jgi:uncharacterized protein YdaU (DUF1376 family)
LVFPRQQCQKLHIMKDPAILFYTADFITGTLTMTNEQKGKYITLLCLQHQKGYLTEKDMLNICKTYDEDIYCKFTVEDEKYYNERMRQEIEKRQKYSESRRNNRIKKNIGEEKEDNICKTYDEHMEDINININIKEKNKYYLPLAKYLSEIIKTKKNITNSPERIQSWANEIRILSEQNKVNIIRIKQALQWYKKNIGGEYVPVIESGSSLKDKFMKLEAAIERSKLPKKKINSNKPAFIIDPDHGRYNLNDQDGRYYHCRTNELYIP